MDALGSEGQPEAEGEELFGIKDLSSERDPKWRLLADRSNASVSINPFNKSTPTGNKYLFKIALT